MIFGETGLHEARTHGHEEAHEDDHGGMAQREEEADSDRPLVLLHQFPGHVVDGRDMVGVHGVPQAATVGQQAHAQGGRVVVEKGQRQSPDNDVQADKKSVDRHDPRAQGAIASVPKAGGDLLEHLFSFGLERTPTWCYESKISIMETEGLGQGKKLQRQEFISDFGFRISDFGFRISDFGFRISDFGFRISDFGFSYDGVISSSDTSHCPRPTLTTATLLAMIDAHDPARLVESLDMAPRSLGLQVQPRLAQGRLRFRLHAELGQLLLVFLALPLGLVLGGQGFFAGLFRFLALLLKLGHLRGPSLPPVQIAMGPPQQFARQLQPAGDLQGVAHAELADVQAIGRPQRLHVELDGGVLGPLVVEGVRLQFAQVRRHHRPAAELSSPSRIARPRAAPSVGSVPAPSSSSSTRLLVVGVAKNAGDVRDVRAEGAQRLFQALLVADVGEDVLEDRHVAALGRRECACPPGPSGRAARSFSASPFCRRCSAR